MFFANLTGYLLLAAAFIVFTIRYALRQIDNFPALIWVLIIFLSLSFFFTYAISHFYRVMKDQKERQKEIQKVYKVSIDVPGRMMFIANTRRNALINDAVMRLRRQVKAEYDKKAEKIREEGKVAPELEFTGKLKKAPYGAYIATTMFSTNENYQYFQMEQINVFYGHVMEYFQQLVNLPEYHKHLSVGFQGQTFYLYYEGTSLDDIEAFVKKLESNFYDIFEKTGIHVNMHPAFGIYILGEKAKEPYDMVQNAVLSLHTALTSYQSYVYFDESLVQSETHDDRLEQEIRKGIQNHDFKVYYQGKFDLATNTFVGAEALIRWQRNGVGTPVSPGAFIGEAEKSGLVHVLDYYVFEQVCKDLGDWKRRGRRMIPISVNFSASDLYRPDFVRSIIHEIDINNISTNYLEVELTETSTANNFIYVMDILQKLNDNHIRILMDDFGTGFSSLGNLAKYPVSALKIDKSFVDNMTTDIKNREIVRTIINLAKALGMESIAEGVDSEEQDRLLREMKCNVIQGYYYCKPMSKQDFEMYLMTNKFEKKGDLL